MSGSTVGIQWLYNEQKTNDERRKDEQIINKRQRKSEGKLKLR